MSKGNDEKILKLMLWKDILIIPIYTILFYYFKPIFWGTVVIDRCINIVLSIKTIKIEPLIDKALESEETKIMQLLIFVAITGITLYILIFMKHRELFYILILLELIDFIISKVL